MVTAPAQAQSARRTSLYLGIGFLSVLLALVGFWPSYFGPVLTQAADKPLILHIHAFVFVGWLALFTAQAYLAASGRVGLHVRVGRFGIAYGFLVLAVGLTTGYAMASGYAAEGNFTQASDLLYSVVLDMLVFAPFFVAAVFFRRRPELHKRLMIIAGTSLLVAAVFRMGFLGRPEILWISHVVWLSPVLLALAADWFRRREVHVVLLVGLTALLLQSPSLRSPVRSTEVWRAISGWILGIGE